MTRTAVEKREFCAYVILAATLPFDRLEVSKDRNGHLIFKIVANAISAGRFGSRETRLDLRYLPTPDRSFPSPRRGKSTRA